MTNKMKLLIGLLVLGIVLLGSGLTFLLLPTRQTGIKIILTPAPGNYLFNSENKSSEVLLKSIQIEKGVNDKQYTSPSYTLHTVNVGDSILVISGSIQNNHTENKEITIYAEGYDKAGKQVAWTMDASSIMGQIGLHLESGETGEFTLHMNFAANIKSIIIFADNYVVPPP